MDSSRKWLGFSRALTLDLLNLEQWALKLNQKLYQKYIIYMFMFFGRKVMTNVNSILKSRDITLSTKVCLVKAMIFPVVVYKCESWIIKKAECQRIDAFEL